MTQPERLNPWTPFASKAEHDQELAAMCTYKLTERVREGEERFQAMLGRRFRQLVNEDPEGFSRWMETHPNPIPLDDSPDEDEETLA